MAVSDETLIERVLHGDQEAFADLVDRYQQKVFNIAFRMTGDREEAMDMAQESFLRVFRSLPRFKGDSTFSTWLFRIVNNTCIDALRRRKRQVVVAMSTDASIDTDEGEYQVEFPSTDDGPEERAMQAEMREAMAQAIEQLSAEHRLALILRDVEGYSYEEIADMLELNIGTVKSRLNRARLSLREIIGSREQLRINNRLKTQKGG